MATADSIIPRNGWSARSRTAFLARLAILYLAGTTAAAVLLHVGYFSRGGNAYEFSAAGMLGAQFALLTMWIALGRRRWQTRFLQCSLAAMTIPFALFFLPGGAPLDDLFSAIVMLPYLLLGSSILFLIPRWIFDWRILLVEDLSNPPQQQYSLRHILISVASIALLCSLARLKPQIFETIIYVPSYWLLLTPLAGLVGVALAPARRALYLLLSVVAVAGYLIFFYGWQIPSHVQEAFSTGMTVAGVYFFLMLLQLRGAGYRLQAALPWLRTPAADLPRPTLSITNR